MKKILTVIGARPQFIKASVVSHAIAQTPGLREVVVHTGQHYDANMSDVFFDELDLRKPDCHLGIGGGSHGEMTGRMLGEIEKVIIAEKPDAVLVYGDTNSTLAGSVAAVKLHVPVAHVEAGLRSFNRRMPEEINRVLTDHAASLLFAPTEAAVRHLAAEGISGDAVQLVGDVMYDAALFYGVKADAVSDVLSRLGLTRQGYALATIHRAENTDEEQRLTAIFEGFARSGLRVVLPLHPRTRARMVSHGLAMPANVQAIDPVGYLDMVMLEKHAVLIVTDSGGVQKEAFFHRVPCVTLRDETEWIELVDSGWNRLVSPACGPTIGESIRAALGSQGVVIQPYGDGTAALKIARMLSGALVVDW